MIDKSKILPDVNTIGATTAVFIEYYNENVPEIFPRATLKALHKFKNTHPNLFKEGSEWTIDKHRKKLMDWLASYREEE